jgi:glycosyltransferase involved in cell wall biosynthesis
MREGLPKSIMEAMAAGKPVVATNIRGNRDLVEHGRTGLLVELGDVRGLTAALERLIADPGLRDSMGRAAQEKIKDYSLDRVLAEMEAIYGRYLGW